MHGVSLLFYFYFYLFIFFFFFKMGRGKRYASRSISYVDPETSTESESSSDIVIEDSSDEIIIETSSSDNNDDTINQKEGDDYIQEEFDDEEEDVEMIEYIEEEEEEEEEYFEDDYIPGNITRTLPKKNNLKKKKKGKGQLNQYTATEVDEEHSITQGCFLVLPKTKKKNLSKTSSLFTSLLEGDESDENMELRFKAYQKHWEMIRTQLQEVRESVYNITFKNICTFVHSQHKKENEDSFDVSLNQSQLPTAVIIVGMNVLDHQRLLNDLVNHIENKNTLVITLQSKDCSNASNTLFSLVSQCLNHSIHPNPPEKLTSKTSVNFRQLIQWYNSLCKAKNVPIGSITIGVLLLDFECFSTEVAQLLVSICSNHIKEIPFTFVIGLATSVTTIHQMLPRSICSKLKMEKFRFSPPNEQLKLILQRVFLENPPIVQLGFQSLQVIFNRFEEANVSVESFSRSLQFTLMEHFFKNPLSFLTLFKKDENPKIILSYLSNSHYNYIRSLPSVKEALSKLPPAKSKLLRQNDTALSQYVIFWMKNIIHSRQIFS